MKRFIVSAPFGNYIQPSYATPTLGTFTVLPRPHRWWRVAKTVRYHRSLKGWTNQIGLRNPGIYSLAKQADRDALSVLDKIVSIHGFTDAEWQVLLSVISADIPALAVELNLSCPNVVDQTPDYLNLFKTAVALPREIIVKLPPVNYERIAWAALESGIFNFHCCNTLPVPAGGLSGKPLKVLSLSVISWLRQKNKNLTIIGGGGIKTRADVHDYHDVGANHFAVGSALFNPAFTLSGFRRLVEESEGI